MSVRALVLSGGGAKGAYEAGAVTSLVRAEPFDIIAGTSIGAINAALAAQHDFDALRSLWGSIAARKVVQPLPVVARTEAFFAAFEAWQLLPDIAKVSHLAHLALLWAQIGSKTALLSLLGMLDETPIEIALKQFANYANIKSTLVVCATDITTRRPTAFYAFAGGTAGNVASFRSDAGMETEAISELNYVEILEASAAIPGAFTPLQMNLGAPPPKFFVDGGVANNTPISLAVAAGADDVTVIFLDPASGDAPAPAPRNLVDIAFACFDVMQQRILENDFKLASLTNVALAGAAPPSKEATRALAGKKRLALRYVRPTTAIPVSILGFDDQSALDAAFAIGIADGQRPTTESEL